MGIVKFRIDQVTDLSVRQSDQWAHYLKSLNWVSRRTKSGVNVALLKSIFGVLTKIQRPKPLGTKELEEIEHLCKKNKAIFIKIEPGLHQDEKILKDKGYLSSNFPLSPPSTLIIDLEKPEKELWEDLSKSAKYSVRRAQREGNYLEYLKKPKKTSRDISTFPIK